MSSSVPVVQGKKTPLNARHRALGARMVEFAGWDMPVEYSGIIDEHMAVRTRAGLFDVSHMGQIEVAGPDALAAVQWMTSNDASRLAVGQIQYSALTTPAGTFVDDVLVYRMGDDHFMMVVNAGNIMKDHEWIVAQARKTGGQAAVVNASSRYALIAIQGPEAQAILQTLTDIDLSAIKYYWFATGEVAGLRATVSRTGYTGEDGFEVFVQPAQAERAWDAILNAGKTADLKPCGLGARDTLRLEAAMRLCGSDMDENVSVLEAGLGWIVGWKKSDFEGGDVLRRQKAGELTRKLATFEMRRRGAWAPPAMGRAARGEGGPDPPPPPPPPRHGYSVVKDGQPVGVVTSGTQTPFLKKSIGMAMVPVDMAVVGTTLQIDVRGRVVPAEVVPEPFYKRRK
jgi:aminomethyltransferase